MPNFHRTFPSNHASQPLQVHQLSISFLFYDFVYFLTQHGLVANFRYTFLSNHASQPLQTWYGALLRGPTCCLPNLCPPVIYFLLYDFFLSDITWSSVKFLSHFSQQPCITATSNLVWCFGYMSHTEFKSASYLLPVFQLTGSLFSDITWSSAKFLSYFAGGMLSE